MLTMVCLTNADGITFQGAFLEWIHFNGLLLQKRTIPIKASSMSNCLMI